MNAIKLVQPICQGNAFGSELQAVAQDLRDNLSYPIVAMGLLHWIRTNLTGVCSVSTQYSKSAHLLFYHCRVQLLCHINQNSANTFSARASSRDLLSTSPPGAPPTLISCACEGHSINSSSIYVRVCREELYSRFYRSALPLIMTLMPLLRYYTIVILYQACDLTQPFCVFPLSFIRSS